MLQVWLPLNGNIKNQGLSNYTIDAVRGSIVYNDSGKIGKCFYAHGVNTLRINNIIPDFYNYSSYSLCAWFYIEAQNTTHSGSAVISAGNWNAQVLNLALGDWSTDHYTTLRISGTSWSRNYAYNFFANQWYHVVVSSDGTSTKAYVNGVLINDTAPGFLPTSIEGNDIYIGGASYYSGMQFFGRINDVRIYDHALSEKEVQEIAKGLVVHYKLADPYLEATTNLGNTSSTYSNMTLGSAYSTGGWGGDTGTVTYYQSGGYCGGPYKVYHKTATGSGGIYRKTANDITIVAGKTYTMSVYVKASREFTDSPYSFNINGITSSNSNYYITYGQNIHFTTEWQRLIKTFTATSADAGTFGEMSIVYNDDVADYYIYYSCFQIEEKDHATSYTPSSRLAATKIYDCSGYQNNATPIGILTASTDTAKYSVATKFINTSYIRSLGRPNNFLPHDAITVNLWMKCTTWGNPISCTEGGGFNFEDKSGIRFPVYISGVGYKLAESGISSSTLLNNWHMLTGTFDKATVKIYIDGELKATTTTSSTNDIGYANNYLFIGAEAAGNSTNPETSTFVGNISDVRIYATALSAAAIKDLYETSAEIDKNGNFYAREIIEL